VEAHSCAAAGDGVAEPARFLENRDRFRAMKM
jgi:hypothetical protein